MRHKQTSASVKGIETLDKVVQWKAERAQRLAMSAGSIRDELSIGSVGSTGLSGAKEQKCTFRLGQLHAGNASTLRRYR